MDITFYPPLLLLLENSFAFYCNLADYNKRSRIIAATHPLTFSGQDVLEQIVALSPSFGNDQHAVTFRFPLHDGG
jgi:hypothetical protein